MREFSFSLLRVFFPNKNSHIIRPWSFGMILLYCIEISLRDLNRRHFLHEVEVVLGHVPMVFAKLKAVFSGPSFILFYFISIVCWQNQRPCFITLARWSRTGRMITGEWAGSSISWKDHFHFIGRGTPSCAAADS